MARCTVYRAPAIAVTLLALGMKGVGPFWRLVAVGSMAFTTRIGPGALFFEVMVAIVACKSISRLG
jgi:hypothetical protein